MAIIGPMMQLILKAGGKGKALSAGYPDLLLSTAMAQQCLKWVHVPYLKDSQQIMDRHSVKLDGIYDAHKFFSVIGYELDVIDFREVRGGEIIVDLNEECAIKESYDLVIDPGTCEHCFHVSRAIMNLAQMVKKGGHIVQGFPLNSYNHGFYCISPTLVNDFYGENGFEVLECFGIVNSTLEKFSVPMTKRFSRIPENAFMLVLAKRKEVVELKAPVQYKYTQIK